MVNTLSQLASPVLFVLLASISAIVLFRIRACSSAHDDAVHAAIEPLPAARSGGPMVRWRLVQTQLVIDHRPGVSHANEPHAVTTVPRDHAAAHTPARWTGGPKYVIEPDLRYNLRSDANMADLHAAMIQVQALFDELAAQPVQHAGARMKQIERQCV